MRLIEVKILYNADHKFDTEDISTLDHIIELMYWVNQRPDVIHVVKTEMLPDGEHDD